MGVQFFELRRREDDLGVELLEPLEVVVEADFLPPLTTAVSKTIVYVT